MGELLSLDFMRQALIAAVLVGIAAPLVGVFLVQRRLSLIGDGLGHVALAGVAVGVLTGQAPVLTALVAAAAAAVAIELIRGRGTTSGDVALSVMFYGGIAAGVVIIAKSPSSNPANLTAREVEVLGLIVEGLSNAAIAERLVLSTRTVDSHVSSILRKLDVSSRGAASAEAARRGLLAQVR